MARRKNGNGHLSLAAWIGIASTALTVFGGGVAVLSRYFAPTERIEAVEKEMAVDDAHDEHADWQVQMLWVEQQNTKSKVDRLDKNVERMMIKQGLEPAPEANVLPLPPPPSSHAATPR